MIGIEFTGAVFTLHGADDDSATEFHCTLTRKQVLPFQADQPQLGGIGMLQWLPFLG